MHSSVSSCFSMWHCRINLLKKNTLYFAKEFALLKEIERRFAFAFTWLDRSRASPFHKLLGQVPLRSAFSFAKWNGLFSFSKATAKHHQREKICLKSFSQDISKGGVPKCCTLAFDQFFKNCKSMMVPPLKESCG